MTHTVEPGDIANPGIDRHPVATIVLDNTNRIIAINMAAQDLLGVSERSTLHRGVDHVLPDFEGRSFAPSGITRAFDVAVARGARCNAVGVMAETADDGTTVLALLADTNASSVRASVEKPSTGSTAAILAHEIKNPLSGIRGAAQLLAQGTKDTERFTGLICREVDRIAALIDRMEILSAERVLEMETGGIFPTIRHALEIVSAGIASDVAVSEAHDPSLPAARFHADSLVQIILNLIANAVEAVSGRPDAMVRVSTGFRHGYWVENGPARTRCEAPIMLCVTDNGDGVPDRILPDLFRPFATTRAGGTGLGLALVDRLARDMGGNVEYHRDKDQGLSHFRLMLLRADEA